MAHAGISFEFDAEPEVKRFHVMQLG